MSGISKDDVLRLARLSRLTLTEDEIVQYQKELEAILHYVEKLQAVDTDGLEPTYQVTGLQNIVRRDEVIDYGTTTKTLLQNAPQTEDGQFKVDRMVG